MISLQCTHCQQRLEMDDAFAGGVCRCQYCGTIQTVPKKGKSAAPGSSPSTSPKGAASKTLYKKNSAGQAPDAPAGAGTGLDELAQVVASSGLARGSLRKPPPARRENGTAEDVESPAPAAPAKGPPMRLVLIGGAAVIAVLLALVIYFAFRTPERVATADERGSKAPTPAAPTPGEQAAPDEPSGPSFAAVPLGETGDVVYLLDRSQANDAFLDALKAATYKSALSLGSKRSFQIIFWHRTDEGIVAYPEDRPAPATMEKVNAARRRFEDVVAYGTTDLKPTIEKAVASDPATVVIATAKGFSLEEANAGIVADAVGGVNVRVHTVSLGEGDSAVLKRIAEHAGGAYRTLTLKQLRAMVD